jgi:hypothetical protein
MEFKQILSVFDTCDQFLSSYNSGLIEPEDLHLQYTYIATSMAEIEPRLSKCVLRAKEPDPEKRFYGAAQTERVLLAESRYATLVESLKSVAAAAQGAMERLKEDSAKTLLLAKTAEDDALKSSIEVNERDKQFKLACIQRESVAAALREKERQEAVERLEEEARVRAALRALEREKELAAAEKEKVAVMKTEELAKQDQLIRERIMREERVNAIVSQAHKAGVGGGTSNSIFTSLNLTVRTGIQQVQSREALFELLRNGSQLGLKVVALFYASWCPQSTTWVSQTQSLVKRFSCTLFLKVDVDISPQLAIEEGALDCPVFKVWEGEGAPLLVSSQASLLDILSKKNE